MLLLVNLWKFMEVCTFMISQIPIYISSVPYYKENYCLHSIEVIGLMIGERGAVASFKSFCMRFNMKEEILLIKKVVQFSIQSSIFILRNHI